MNNIILLEGFNVTKLKFFFESARKGFVLLTINEYHILQKIRECLSEWIAPRQYNMAESSFQDVVEDFSEGNAVDSAVFYHFYLPDADNRKILEQFNLGRDLILNRIRFCVFIVPVYMENYIQDSLPNLYSYFQVKERFLRERQECFEYILPEDRYRETRSMSETLQAEQEDGRDDLFHRLNDFLYVQVSHEAFLQLKQDAKEFIESILDSELQSDEVLFYQITMKLLKVAIVQEEHDVVMHWFETIKKYFSSYKNTFFRLEIECGVADSGLYIQEYERVQELCFHALQEIKDLSEDAIVNNTRTEYQIRINAKLVLCQIRLGKVEEAKGTMAKTLDLIHARTTWENIDVFLIYYNFFIIYLQIYSERSIESERMLENLEQMPKDEVQQAMYLTVCAWYEGVIEGKLHHAIRISKEALQLKRKLYPANDARIAESYYVEAMLYFFTGDDREAVLSCQKCARILVSLNRNTDLKEINQILEEEIWQYID